MWRCVRYRWFWIVSLLIFAADQLTKLWVLSAIPAGTYHVPIEVIERWVYWVHVYNTGAAWSILEGQSVLLVGVAVATLSAIYWARKALLLHRPLQQSVFGLLVGGVLGNLVDRLRFGYVIDFIDVHLPFYRWPAFNVADAAIVSGVCIYVWLTWRTEQKP